MVSDISGSTDSVPMRKEILFATAGYVTSVAVLLSFLYWLMKNEGFDETTFLIGSVFVLLLSIGWGYIIASHLIVPHRRTKSHLMRLIKDIVHELNIPLSTIRANTAMLAKKTDDEKNRKRIERIDDATVRLKKLYDELVYTIKREVHQVEREHFDLAQSLSERVEIFCEQRRNPIVTQMQSMEVYADKIGFERMFDNLLSNAMKYSPRQMPVTVRLNERYLEISDRGIGMDEAQLLKVYERYYQVDGTKEGEGIGLALVKAYCDQEGISIRIDSKRGEGTVVKLDLSSVVHAAFTSVS